MKIALVSEYSSIHTVRWVNALVLRGHDVSLFYCKTSRKAPSPYDPGVRLFQLKYTAPFGYYLNARCLKKMLRREKFDIINVHYASGYGTLGRRAKVSPALLNIWGSDIYEYPYRSVSAMRLILKNLCYYDHLASTSECMARQTRKVLKEPDKEIYITPFGVDTERFKPLLGMRNEDVFLIGTVKTLSPKYGIADSIRAFIMLYNRLIDEGQSEPAGKLRYEIYGDGELRDALQNLIDQNGMTDRVKLCGYVDNKDLPSVINRFNIFNSNSNSESFGVAAVEAMACGVPVSVTDADGFAEVVEDGVTGLIAPKGDIAAICDNLFTLLMDSEMRERFGNAGIERVKRLYDWDKNVDLMENVYRKIVK